MVKKKRKKLNEFQRLERGVERDIRGAEKWMIERRKFFIKLGLITIFVLILLLIASML